MDILFYSQHILAIDNDKIQPGQPHKNEKKKVSLKNRDISDLFSNPIYLQELLTSHNIN